MPFPSQKSSFLVSQKENMDQFNHQNIQTQRQFSNSHLKKAIQFILTVSVMSFFFSYSSPLSFLLHSFNVYFYTFSMQLNSYNTIDRKLYVFLLCNGILVLIVKNSGLIGNYPLGTDHYDEHIKNHGDSQQLLLEVSKAKKASVAREVVMEIEEEEDGRYNGFLIAEDEDKEQAKGILVTKEEKEEEEEEEGSIGLLSVEELNKKCDEFIKMMKEGIKTEAQQLIMV